jgi:hypothetical protein
MGALEKLRSRPGLLPVGRPPPLVLAHRRRRPGVVRTVRAWCRLSGLVSQAVCHTYGVLHKCCFIFYFVVVFFSSTTFGLYFFYGGGYCGCVSLNIFSASFSWLSFALRRYNFRFWDRVNPAGHHRGMEYFGSAILMVAVSSILFVLADSPKIIGPSLSFCMTTSDVPILIMSFFVVLSVAVGICPPAGLVDL